MFSLLHGVALHIYFYPERGSLVGSASLCMLAVTKSKLVSKIFFIEFFPSSAHSKREAISNWRKNGHLILVTCLCVREECGSCTGTGW